MAYPCTKYLKEECDGCGACKEEPVYICSDCECRIYRGDTCFNHDDRVYCERCNDLSRETA